MLFTTKTEYGLRAMVALGRNRGKKPMSISLISAQEHISRHYLEHLFSKLKADGLVKSSKGVAGGYFLARQPKNINMFEIVEALEGPLAVFHCISDNNSKMFCSNKKCLTREVWLNLQSKIISTLRKFTLEDLI